MWSTLGQCKRPGRVGATSSSCSSRSKQEESILLKLFDELDKSTTATCKKTPGPAKGGRKNTVYKGHPSIQGLFKSCKLKTVRVCVLPSKTAETLPGHDERKLSSVHTHCPQPNSRVCMPCLQPHLDGSSSTDCAKLVLLEHTPVQLSGTSAAPIS